MAMYMQSDLPLLFSVPAREKTPFVDGELIDISSDGDIPAPPRPPQSISTEVIIISSDDEALPGPSKTVSFAGFACTLRGRPAHPHGNKQEEAYIVVVDSDEEVAIPPLSRSVSGTGRPESPLDIQSRPRGISGTGLSEPPEQLDSVDLDLTQSSLTQVSPPLEFPASPPPYVEMDANMDMDFGRPSAVLAGEGGNGIRGMSVLRAESPADSGTLNAADSKAVASPDETVESSSPADAETVAVDLFDISCPDSRLSEADPTSPPAPAPKTFSSPIPTDLLSTALVPIASPPFDHMPVFLTAPHPYHTARTLTTTQTAIQIVGLPPATSDFSDIPTFVPSKSPPVRLPLPSQIRTEPSVPPLPAADAYDWGPRHHGSGGLFKNVLARLTRPQGRSSSTLINSVPPNNTQFPGNFTAGTQKNTAQTFNNQSINTSPIPTKHKIKTLTVSQGVRLPAEEQPLNALQGQKEDVPLSATPTTGPSRSHDGQTLRDVM